MMNSQWIATYQSATDPPTQLVVSSNTRPKKKRTFRTPRGLTLFQATSIKRQGSKPNMARKTKDIDDELDELEAAFDEDDLEELDELEEEEAPKPRAKRQTAAQKRAAAKKAAAEAEEDEDEDDEEPEEKPAAKRRSRSKTSAEPKAGATKTRTKTAEKKGGQPSQLVRELPAGKYGAAEIAELAGVDSRAVRVFLRKNSETFPKNEELGRYAFTKREAEKIAKALKA